MSEKLLDRRYKLAGHISFWILSVTVLSLIFYLYEGTIKSELVFKSILTNTGFALAVYVNLYVLIPRFLKKKNYIYYVFWLVILLTLSSLYIQNLFIYPFHWLFQGTDSFTSFNTVLHSAFFFTALLYILITSFLKFIKDWLELQDLNLKMARLEKQRFEAELKTLKSQLNPHFLFNSLNNIYSLALIQSDKVPNLILQLSDLMRYIIYETRDNFVPVEKEVEFVKNYVALQQIRLPKGANVTFALDEELKGGSLLPLIFEPFIDNAFKHASLNDLDNDYIKIKLGFSEEHRVRFHVSNSYNPERIPSNKKYSGIGIENAKQRLHHLYDPEDYDLRIDKTNYTYNVTLDLKLK